MLPASEPSTETTAPAASARDRWCRHGAVTQCRERRAGRYNLHPRHDPILEAGGGDMERQCTQPLDHEALAVDERTAIGAAIDVRANCLGVVTLEDEIDLVECEVLQD